MGVLATRHAAIVTTLTTAGVTATRDPSAVVPPCVWVAAPAGIEVNSFGQCAYNVTWTVYAVGRAPGNVDGLDDCLTLIESVASTIKNAPGESWEPTTVTPQQITYPAYRLELVETVNAT